MKELLIASLVALGIAVVTGAQGCALLGDHCEVGAGCDGPHRQTTCESTEDGETYSSTDECPAEQTCIADPKTGIGGCTPSDVGGSCKTDAGCLRWLRCMGGFCAGPPAAVADACAAAPVVDVPDDGRTIDVVVTIDQTDPVFGRCGMIHLSPSTRFIDVRFDSNDPAVLRVAGTTCGQLYDSFDGAVEALPDLPTAVAVVSLKEGSDATSVHVNVHRE